MTSPLPSSVDLTPMGALAPLLRAVAILAAERTPAGDPAHDFAHVQRVTASAHALAVGEGADLGVVLPAALLHELFNHPKGHPESHRSGEVCAEHARALLREVGYPEALAEAAAYAIAVHPFSLGVRPTTLEGRVLQDADRLDALGAVGVARCFSTGAVLGARFYADDDPFCETRTPDDKAYSVDHFSKKLLRIPDSLHTASARARAVPRVAFLRSFLENLRSEIG